MLGSGLEQISKESLNVHLEKNYYREFVFLVVEQWTMEPGCVGFAHNTYTY